MVAGINHASVTDKQLQQRRSALRKLEKELRLQREQVKFLEIEEKGVLNTISLIDQNLNQTREYLAELERNEQALDQSVKELVVQIDSLNQGIEAQQRAMKKRIRELYIRGGKEKWEQLYRLIRLNENPARQIYLVRRLLEDDQSMVEQLQQSIHQRDQSLERMQKRLDELKRVRSRKASEEKGLQGQLTLQSQTLDKLKTDKEAQRKALAEYERNQKTMLSLIKALEKKRKKERAEAAKRKKAQEKKRLAQKKTSTKKKIAVVEPQEESVKIGPKCMPLKGEVISSYGYHEHKVLHTMTRNLGAEIRGRRGQAVKVAAAGTVALVTRIDGRGPSVIVDHGNSIYSVYGHLAAIRVREGQTLRHCQDLGDVGDAESMNGYKLYFQVSQGTHTLDPMVWLRSP